MLRSKKNTNQQTNNAPIERKRALSGDSLLVRATVGEGNLLRLDHVERWYWNIFNVGVRYLFHLWKVKKGTDFLGEGNDLLLAEAETINKPFILASTGERNNISTSGGDGGFLTKSKEGTVYHKYFLYTQSNFKPQNCLLL